MGLWSLWNRVRSADEDKSYANHASEKCENIGIRSHWVLGGGERTEDIASKDGKDPEQGKFKCSNNFFKIEAYNHLDEQANEKMVKTVMKEKRQEKAVDVALVPYCIRNPHAKYLLSL